MSGPGRATQPGLIKRIEALEAQTVGDPERLDRHVSPSSRRETVHRVEADIEAEAVNPKILGVAARLGGLFENEHLLAGPGEGDGGAQTTQARADDNRIPLSIHDFFPPLVGVVTKGIIRLC